MKENECFLLQKLRNLHKKLYTSLVYNDLWWTLIVLNLHLEMLIIKKQCFKLKLAVHRVQIPSKTSFDEITNDFDIKLMQQTLILALKSTIDICQTTKLFKSVTFIMNQVQYLVSKLFNKLLKQSWRLIRTKHLLT